jgi:probable blue pigment (indigoidine) exporter
VSLRDAGLAALAPASWGLVYVVTAGMLPPDRPLLAALLRALPIGLLMLLWVRRLPSGSWWWRAGALGILNIGAFFPLIFVAAYRLPGGVAATIGALAPLLVAAFGLLVLRQRTPRVVLLAALAGAAGVALLTLTSAVRLDPLGVAAAVGAVSLMSLGLVLGKKWGSPVPPLTLTAWQLTVGGLALLPLTLLVEGLPSTITAGNLLGYGYIAVIATGLAYALWFRGLERLHPASLSLLGLINPVVAAAGGFLFLRQTLTGWQLLGIAIALAALAAGQLLGRRVPAGGRTGASGASGAGEGTYAAGPAAGRGVRPSRAG